MGGMGEMSMGVGTKMGKGSNPAALCWRIVDIHIQVHGYIHACVGVHVEKCVGTSERLIHTPREKDIYWMRHYTCIGSMRSHGNFVVYLFMFMYLQMSLALSFIATAFLL